VERFWVRFPNFDAGPHHGAHRGLVVKIADDAAGYAGGPGGDGRFVNYQNILAGTTPAGSEFPGQMPAGAQAMHPGSDDQVFD
jgi:hypothetical protein